MYKGKCENLFDSDICKGNGRLLMLNVKVSLTERLKIKMFMVLDFYTAGPLNNVLLKKPMKSEEKKIFFLFVIQALYEFALNYKKNNKKNYKIGK